MAGEKDKPKTNSGNASGTGAPKSANFDAILAQLAASGGAPQGGGTVFTEQEASAYVQAVYQQLLGRNAVGVEYRKGVNAFLRFYSSASTASSVANNLNLWQQTALTLNEKVNTMISLINYLASMNVANMRSLQSQLMSQTTSITSSTNALQEQADILRDNNKTNALYKQMMDYTEEKNRANKNLLAVYFTLNVVAITCLFIAARSL
jgi:hypothetical protein